MVHALEINEVTFPASRITSIATIVNLIIPLAITGVALVFLLVLIHGAFLWISSSGNPEKLEKSHKKITYGFIGFFIVVMSYLIVRIIGYILGIDFMI